MPSWSHVSWMTQGSAMTIVSLVVALALIAEPPSASAAPTARQRLMVPRLHHAEELKDLADALTEVELTEAARFQRLTVLGESDLAALLGNERRQQMLGCGEDSSCMAELAGAAGADLLLVGSLSRLGSATRLDLKLLDVHKAQVLGRSGETVSGSSDQAIAAIQHAVVALLRPIAGPQAGAAGQNRFLHARTRVREEVLVSNHKTWNRACKAGPTPVIQVTRPPQHGTVELRRGSFVVEGSWIRPDDRSCDGHFLPGLGVYYQPTGPGPGRDSFHYQLISGFQLDHVFEVEVEVEVD